MNSNPFDNRRFMLIGLSLAVALIFLARLFYLQVIDDSYKLSAENNVVRAIPVFPNRGYIYDRTGKLMVSNQSAYDLMITPNNMKNIDTSAFCLALNITKEDFEKKYKKARKYSNYKSSVFVKELSKETFASLQEQLYNYPGFFVQQRMLREYPIANGSNVIGFISQVTNRNIGNNNYYRTGDNIGVSGIEKSYEKELRGYRGVRYIVRDVYNREQGSFKEGLYDTLPKPGQDIVASISADLQAYGEQLMINKIGSIVAIEPSTGEILALISSPTYDPNLLVGRQRTINYNKLYYDPLKPLYDRSLLAEYPPGSTFKMLNALIALQEGVISPSSTFSCNGSFTYGTKLKVGCHHRDLNTNLKESIVESCNTYYCLTYRGIIEKYSNTAEGYTNWRKHIMSFGLGSYLGNDLPTGKRGLVPSKNYYDRVYGKNSWRAVTNISLAIGQGELLATPIQLANMTAAIANRGYYFTPHIVQSVGGKKDFKSEYLAKHHTTIEPKYFNPIINAMQAVVEGDDGTARGAKIKDITICAKTGTAQNPSGEDHSVFIAFAPKENPQIAICVYVENAGWGSSWAAPIASLMIEKHLKGSVERKYLEDRMLEGNLLPEPKITEANAKD
ncbi:MAG: penicillin-binding protein 2 [Candidatus Azotimanducaceae bacterium]|jgi:penicillin-binding protein 2